MFYRENRGWKKEEGQVEKKVEKEKSRGEEKKNFYVSIAKLNYRRKIVWLDSALYLSTLLINKCISMNYTKLTSNII